MLNRLAELIIRHNSSIHRALLLTYPFVFVDEFQDTTLAQYSFLKSVFGGHGTVVTAVGDNKQRIMGWAGALKDVFTDFEREFDATRFSLTRNFRSSEALTRLHHVVAASISDDSDPAISQIDDQVDGKSAEIWRFEDAQAEAQEVAKFIRDDIQKSGRMPDSYALLARQRTSDLQKLLEPALASHGIPLRNDDSLAGDLRLQDLFSDDLVQRILDILRLAATDRGGGSAWIRVSDLVSVIHDGSASEEAVTSAHRGLEKFIATLRDWLASHPPTHDAIDRVIGEIVSYLGIAAICATFPVHRRHSYLEQTTASLIIRFKEVLNETSDWSELCDRAEGRGAVSLMTIHKSKGLEYHTVVVLGVDDDQWWSFTRDPDEAVRTFFVGLSRAEQRTIFTSCKERGARHRVKPLYMLLQAADVAEVHPLAQLQLARRLVTGP